MSVDNALQTAIYTALTGGAYAVYDHVPQDTAYPYITIGSHDVAERDLVTGRLEDHFFYVTLWSDYRGAKECNAMADWVVAQLHRQWHTLTTGEKCKTHVTRRRVQPDVDGQTYQGNLTVAAVVQPGS